MCGIAVFCKVARKKENGPALKRKYNKFNYILVKKKNILFFESLNMVQLYIITITLGRECFLDLK